MKREQVLVEAPFNRGEHQKIALLSENSIYYILRTRLFLGILAGNQFEDGFSNNTYEVYTVSFKPQVKYLGGFKALCLYHTTAQC